MKVKLINETGDTSVELFAHTRRFLNEELAQQTWMRQSYLQRLNSWLNKHSLGFENDFKSSFKDLTPIYYITGKRTIIYCRTLSQMEF